jgi:tetratricopeptide (TPR) repeat protein
MTRKIFIVITTAVLWAGARAEAQDPAIEAAFNKGNACYESGQYPSAIAEYEKILNGGYESANIYFDLGNAYYRSGRIGKAILNYCRAKRLKPDDPDTVSNYRFVKRKILAPVVQEGSFWTLEPISRYDGYFTADGVLGVSASLFILAMAALLLAILKKENFLKYFAAFLVLVTLMFFNYFIAWHKIYAIGKEAVVTVPSAETHYGPADTATVYFKLTEGSEVLVLDEKDEWYRVKRADGKTGWIKKDGIEII